MIVNNVPELEPARKTTIVVGDKPFILFYYFRIKPKFIYKRTPNDFFLFSYYPIDHLCIEMT